MFYILNFSMRHSSILMEHIFVFPKFEIRRVVLVIIHFNFLNDAPDYQKKSTICRWKHVFIHDSNR